MRSLLLLLLHLAPVVLEGSNLHSLGADDQVVRQDHLESQARKDGSRSEQQAKQVLPEAKLDSLEGLSTILDHGQLDDNGGHHDHEEELVVEEVLEDVVLVVLELTSVDLVEDLQQDEDVEEDRVVLAGLVVPLTHTDRGRNAEQFGT
jgi:hypothetical protein